MSALTARLVLACALSLLSAGLAQPYAADGGFDRPAAGVEVVRAELASVLDEGTPRLLVGDASGLRLLDLDHGADDLGVRWLLEGEVVRGVAAASGFSEEDSAVYAWYVRDTRTGHYSYTWQWGERRRPLFDSQQALDMALFLGADGPEAWFALPGAAGARLERHVWDASEAQLVLQSERSMAAPTLARDDLGRRHLAYLEGVTVDTPVGRSSEWSAVYLGPDGVERRFEGALGPPARLVLDASDPPLLAWMDEHGELLVSEPSTAGEVLTLGSGRAVGIVGDRIFWTRGASVVATRVPARDAARVIHTNVAWSPYTIDRATLLEADGVTHLSWSGTLAGGGSRLLHAHDGSTFAPSWRDHLAARFGWTPWALGEEAAGQATGALLVGVLGTMSLLPLLWLLAWPLAPRLGERWLLFAGSLSSVVLLGVLGLAVVALADQLGNDALALLGGAAGFAGALACGAILPPLALSRIDLETHPAFIAASSLASFVSLSLIAFLSFQPWLQALGV